MPWKESSIKTPECSWLHAFRTVCQHITVFHYGKLLYYFLQSFRQGYTPCRFDSFGIPSNDSGSGCSIYIVYPLKGVADNNDVLNLINIVPAQGTQFSDSNPRTQTQQNTKRPEWQIRNNRLNDGILLFIRKCLVFILISFRQIWYFGFKRKDDSLFYAITYNLPKEL